MDCSKRGKVNMLQMFKCEEVRSDRSETEEKQ